MRKRQVIYSKKYMLVDIFFRRRPTKVVFYRHTFSSIVFFAVVPKKNEIYCLKTIVNIKKYRMLEKLAECA